MNARSNSIGKVFSLFLLVALALCICTPVLAASGTTILTTTVPSHFDMNVTIVGNGTVIVNGRELSETGAVSTERGNEVVITISPDEGHHISAVIYNGADIVEEVKGGQLILPQLEGEVSISVIFAADSSSPSTGDDSYPSVVFFNVTAIISLLGIVVLLTVNRKKSNHI